MGDGADAVSVAVADEVALEIELEADNDDLNLELELDWIAPDDESAVPSAASQPDDESAVSSAASQPDDESAVSSAESRPDDESAVSSTESQPDEPAAEPPLAVATDTTQSMARFEVFRDRADEWRWRLRHRNGNIIAVSGEGYTQKHNAQKGLRSVMANSSAAEIHEESTD